MNDRLEREAIHHCAANPVEGNDFEGVVIATYDNEWHVWDMVELSGPSFWINYCPFCGEKLEKPL